MYVISKEVEFDTGHRVPNHDSKCRNPHGHRYKVRVHIQGELVTTKGASNQGMLADFGDLKTLMTERIHDVLDHAFVMWEHDDAMMGAFGVYPSASGWDNENGFKIVVVPFIPTAENIAKWCWDQLEWLVTGMGFDLSLVEVYETPTSVARYSFPPMHTVGVPGVL